MLRSRAPKYTQLPQAPAVGIVVDPSDLEDSDSDADRSTPSPSSATAATCSNASTLAEEGSESGASFIRYVPPTSKGRYRHPVYAERDMASRVIAILRRPRVLRCIEKEEHWVNVRVRGRSGWAKMDSSRGVPVFREVDRWYRYEEWEGNNLFLFNGRVMLGSDWRTTLYTTSLVVGPTLAYLADVAPRVREGFGVALALPAVVGMLATLAFLWRAATMDPGIIPRNTSGVVPPHPLGEAQGAEGGGSFRFCETCNVWRPPRAKHCGACDNCVEQFDHHCPWVGTCIGRRNYVYFLAFVISVTLQVVYVLVVTSVFVGIRASRQRKGSAVLAVAAAAKQEVVAMALIVFLFFIVWSLLGLSGYHVYLTSVAATTNEMMKGAFRDRTNENDEGCARNWARACLSAVPASLLDPQYEVCMRSLCHTGGDIATAGIQMREGVPRPGAADLV